MGKAGSGRRSNREGSITRRADGRWQGALRLPDGTRKYVYGSTRAKVVAKLSAASRAIEQGLPVADDRLTLGHYLEEWLAAIEPTLRDTTYQRHMDYVRLHIAPALGHVRLSLLTARQVQELYAAKLASGLSPTTVHRMHATLHKALSAAVRMDLVMRNVAALVEVPSDERTEMRPLSPEEARTFVEVIREKGVRDEALFLLAITTGMRQGEILGLRWRDVDLAGGSLQVRGSVHMHRQTGEYVLTEPKTPRSRRQVMLAPQVVSALSRLRARQMELGMAAAVAAASTPVSSSTSSSSSASSSVSAQSSAASDGERRSEDAARASGPDWSDLVFTSSTGQPLHGSTVYHRLLRILAAAGLPAIRFHDLRHTCATLLFNAGVDARVIADLLGHSSVAVTLDIYAHVLPARLRDAVAAIGLALQVTGAGASLETDRGSADAPVACPHCGKLIGGAPSGGMAVLEGVVAEQSGEEVNEG